MNNHYEACKLCGADIRTNNMVMHHATKLCKSKREEYDYKNGDYCYYQEVDHSIQRIAKEKAMSYLSQEFENLTQKLEKGLLTSRQFADKIIKNYIHKKETEKFDNYNIIIEIGNILKDTYEHYKTDEMMKEFAYECCDKKMSNEQFQYDEGIIKVEQFRKYETNHSDLINSIKIMTDEGILRDMSLIFN